MSKHTVIVAIIGPDGETEDVGTAFEAQMQGGPDDEVRVVHEDRKLGRGHWIFKRSQLRPATGDEASAYDSRCLAIIHGIEQGDIVIVFLDGIGDVQGRVAKLMRHGLELDCSENGRITTTYDRVVKL